MKRKRFSLSLGCLVLLSACDAGTELREYPGLLDLPPATIAEIHTTAPVPGRYNVTAAVVQVNACSCPPDALCGPCPPDGLLLSESGAPRPPGWIEPGDPNFLYVEAEDPEQFETGRRYALSIAVGAGETQPALRIAELLGYDPVD